MPFPTFGCMNYSPTNFIFSRERKFIDVIHQYEINIIENQKRMMENLSAINIDEQELKEIHAPKGKCIREFNFFDFTFEEWNVNCRIPIMVVPLGDETSLDYLYIDRNDIFYDIKKMVYLKKQKDPKFHPDNLRIFYAGICGFPDDLRLGQNPNIRACSSLHVVPIHLLRTKDEHQPIVSDPPPSVEIFPKMEEVEDNNHLAAAGTKNPGKAINYTSPIHIRINHSKFFKNEDKKDCYIRIYQLDIEDEDNEEEFREEIPTKKLIYVRKIEQNKQLGEDQWETYDIIPLNTSSDHDNKRAFENNKRYIFVFDGKFRWEFETFDENEEKDKVAREHHVKEMVLEKELKVEDYGRTREENFLSIRFAVDDGGDEEMEIPNIFIV